MHSISDLFVLNLNRKNTVMSWIFVQVDYTIYIFLVLSFLILHSLFLPFTWFSFTFFSFPLYLHPLQTRNFFECWRSWSDGKPPAVVWMRWPNCEVVKVARWPGQTWPATVHPHNPTFSILMYSTNVLGLVSGCSYTHTIL